MNALAFITNTRGVAPSDASLTPTGDHQLAVIGYRRQRERIYFLESYAADKQAPALFSMNLTGQYAGRTVPVKDAVNENDHDVESIERRVMSQVTELAPLLRPLPMAERTELELSTRVVRRTALVLGNDAAPVRKFVIKLAIGRTGTRTPARHHYISTYLRPRVCLERVYRIPNRDQAIAIVSYVGLPFGLGDRVEQPVLVDLH